MELQGKVAIVTGGGRGIGRGIVDRFREEGAKVAVVQRRELDETLAADPSVMHVAADLGDPASPTEIITRTVDYFGGVDILVNNAGIMFERHLSEMTLDEWDRMAAINLRTPVFLAQAAIPQFRERGGGSVVNIGSIEGHVTNPHHTAYAATKAGIHGMTRAMALDLGELGVRCNAIAPGWIMSDLSEKYLASRTDPLAAREALHRLHPLGSLGRPEDVGDLAVYLAGERSKFLNGEVVVLDGGRTIRVATPD